MVPMILIGLAFFGLLGRICLIALLGVLAFSNPSFWNWVILLLVGALSWENNATTWFPSFKKFFGKEQND